MNFKEYFEEANIQRLTTEEEKQVSDIADYVWFKIKPLNPEQINKLKQKAVEVDGDLYTNIGEIFYTRRDLKTPKARNKSLIVYINWSDNEGKHMAAFVPHTNANLDYIEISYESLKNIDSKFRFKALLSHELIHAVQHYRKTSERYGEVAEKPLNQMQFYDWVDYYSEPAEKEAVFSEMDSYIRQQYNVLIPSSKNKSELNDYLNRNREKYLLELKLFVTTPLENYIVNKELPLPSALQSHDWFLTVLLRRTPGLAKIQVYPEVEKKLTELKKEFKRKMLSTFADLQKKEANLKNANA